MRVEDTSQSSLYVQSTNNQNNLRPNNNDNQNNIQPTNNSTERAATNQNAVNQGITNDPLQSVQVAEATQTGVVYERYQELAQSQTATASIDRATRESREIVTGNATIPTTSEVASMDINPEPAATSVAATATVNYSAGVNTATTYTSTTAGTENAEPQVDNVANVATESESTNEIPSQADIQAQNTIYLIQQNFQIQANHSEVAENLSGVISGASQSDNTETLWDAQHSTPQSQSEALISENGFWGVEQTSQRIFDLAVSIAGDDPTQMENMREAITRGFDAAERHLGGQLPEISQQTFNAVMENFDNWGLA